VRIAFLTPEFVTEPFFAGGLANYLGRVTTSLVRRGHQAEVFVPADQDESVDYHGVLVHRVRSAGSGALPPLIRAGWVLNTALTKLRMPTFRLTLWAISTAFALDRALRLRHKEAEFDVVQASDYGATALWAARRAFPPVITRASGHASSRSKGYGSRRTLDRHFYARLEVASVRRCRRRYAPSKLVAEIYELEEGIQMDVLEPPFYMEEVGWDYEIAEKLLADGEYALHFGKLSRLKGSGVLAEAIEPLLRAHPELRLVLAGDVNPLDGQRLIALRQHFPNQVLHLGTIPAPELYPVIAGAKIVVLPSLLDNLPNTCLEAMALGKVVIGTRGASFDQLIEDGTSGFLVERHDPTALRAAILKAWALHEHEREGIGEAARARIRKLEPSVILPRLEQYYQSITAPREHDARSNASTTREP
jgi:glycosyltransferase involved in cell wall biosynthesis